MPFLTIGQTDFKYWQNHIGDAAPVAQKTVKLSGKQRLVRVTGAASMLSYIQSGSNHEATMAPFNIRFGDPSSQEQFYADTRCKDTFDITIPFDGKNQIGFFVVWKGSYTWYPVEQVFGFGLITQMEISIHEIM